MTTSRLRLVLAALLFLMVPIVFRPALDCDFINLDDPSYIQNNPILHSGPLDAFSTIHAGYWIPLTWLSYQFDYALGGLSPPGYHRTNVLLHGATASLLFLVLCRMTSSLGRSFVVASLFAFHPIQVESVAWVTERKDVLSTLFLVLTLSAYARFVDQPGLWRYLLVVLLFVLGLMAKPMLVTVPVVLLLLDFWPLRRWEKTTWRLLILEKVPLLLIALAAGLLTVWTQKQGTAVRSLDEFSLYARLGNAAVGYVIYLKMLVWPHPLAVFYPHPGEQALWQVAGSALLLLGITGFAFSKWRTAPHLLTGWLWYLITLAPVSGVLQAGWQGQADRFVYVPSIGLFMLAVWSISSRVAAGVAIVACIVLTQLQLRHWRDSLTLWEHTVNVTTDNFTGRDSLAAALLDRGRAEEAIPHLLRAKELKPDHELAPYLLALAYLQLKQPTKAESELKRAIELNREYVEAYAVLAELLAGQGRAGEAEAHANTALTLAPRSSDALRSLAVVRLKQDRIEEMLTLLRQAVEVDPHAQPVRAMLIKQLRLQGLHFEADEQTRLMRRYYPSWEPVKE